MSDAGPSALGPQCLSCKRRRVKCDSTTPFCKRCQRDDIECPGYIRKLRWNYYQPRTLAKNGPKTTTVTPEDQSNVSLAPLAFIESQDDKENRLLLDSSQYFNSQMLPHLVPAERPFRRADQQATQWTQVPSLLRNLMLLLVHSDQARRISPEGKNSLQVLRFRAQSLTDMKAALDDAVEDPWGIALSCIITLMGIELQNPDSGQWTWLHHFHAANRIIQLRGGFAKCFFSLQYSQRLLLKFMMLDIFTSTTCTIDQLSDLVFLQAKYTPILLLREQSLVENGHLCPQPLLQATIDTNILRMTTQTKQHNPPPDLPSFHTILSSIQNFSPSNWANKVSCYGSLQPTTPQSAPSPILLTAWHSLAQSYQHAAHLYLIFSTRAPTTPPDLAANLHIQENLSATLGHLFSLADKDPDGPVETQLWKFVLWPAFISMYVNICWYCEDPAEMERELEPMRILADAFPRNAVVRSLRALREIAAKRAASGRTQWRWNDGLGSRAVIAIGGC